MFRTTNQKPTATIVTTTPTIQGNNLQHQVSASQSGQSQAGEKLKSASLNSSKCCVIMAISEIIYDNPVLNDNSIQKLLRFATERFGNFGANELIEIGRNPKNFNTFQHLRQQIGDEMAVTKWLNGALLRKEFVDA